MLHTCLEGVEVGVGSKVEGQSGLEVVSGQRWDNLLGIGRGKDDVGLRSWFQSFRKPGSGSGLHGYDICLICTLVNLLVNSPLSYNLKSIDPSAHLV